MSIKKSPVGEMDVSDAFSTNLNKAWPHETEPTPHELKSLRRVAGKVPLTCWYIAVVELAERFTYYGFSAPFQNYAQNSQIDFPKGMLGLGSHDATALSYFWQFWCFASPLLGAYIADSHLGKYRTICWFTVIYTIGMFITFISSLPIVHSYGVRLAGFIMGLIVIGLGTGGIKSNISTLIADQVSGHKPRVKLLKDGEKVIEDPSMTVQNVFMIFYLMINIGSLSVLATSAIELHVDFWAAFLMPLCVFSVVPIFLYLGRNSFVQVEVREKVIAKAFKCVFIALRHKLDFNAAKPSLHPEIIFTWNDHFVDEVERAVYACKVFLFYPVFWLVYGQMMSNFVSQAGQMESHGIPNDMLQVANSVSIILLIPVCEYALYPLIRKFTPFKAITRIYSGLVVASIGMVYAAILQHFIYKAGPCFTMPKACAPEFLTIPNQIHVLIQLPCYALLALSEILASVTGLEYAYTKAPASMKSFIMALFLLTIATGSAIGIALAPMARDPYMTWIYWGLAGSSFLSACVFYGCFRRYNAKEEEWNDLSYGT